MVSLSVVRYFFASILATSTLITAQNVINIDVPQANSQILSKDTLNITYTVIGSQAANPPFDAQTTYPTSLSIDFVWNEHANPNNQLSFSVSTGLITDSYPGGLQNIQHIDSWKIPNCHFFSRYPPTTYDFSLIFTPNYPIVTSGAPNVGTAQSAIIVPLAVVVDNSTFPKC